MSNIVSILPPTSITPRNVNAPGLIQEIAETYLTALSRRGRSKSTIISYECDLGQFIGYSQPLGIEYVQHITADAIDGFIDALVKGKNYKLSTVSRKREALRGFFDYCIKRELIRSNPVDDSLSITYSYERKNAPSTEALLNAIESISTKKIVGIRDRAFFRLLFDAACRASEPCRLDMYNAINPPANTVTPEGVVIYTVKGGAIQSNPIDEVTMDYLSDWLSVRERWARPSQTAMFVSMRGSRVTRQTMHARVKEIGKAVGMDDLHMHLFRHRRAGDVIETLGLRAGADLLHHKDVNTTQLVYGHCGEAHRHGQLRRECALPKK